MEKWIATAMAWNPGVQLVAVAQRSCCVDLQVYVWDMQAAATSSASVRVLKHHKEAVVAAGWSSNCMTLVSCDKGGAVAFWQCTN